MSTAQNYAAEKLLNAYRFLTGNHDEAVELERPMSRPVVCLSPEWAAQPPVRHASVEAFLAHCRATYGEEPALELKHGAYYEGDETVLVDADSYEPLEAGHPKY